ncbi:MAG TPA: hypothetical protein VMM92_09385, partial [Thermoanaerobaculia bacterium]|nr:hypothetical protein [Thermoanaerobaculia bacterium]
MRNLRSACRRAVLGLGLLALPLAAVFAGSAGSAASTAPAIAEPPSPPNPAGKPSAPPLRRFAVARATSPIKID